MRDRAHVRLVGVDRFCPDCGRVLVVIEGGIGIPQNDVYIDVHIPANELGETSDTYTFDATCMICHPHATSVLPVSGQSEGINIACLVVVGWVFLFVGAIAFLIWKIS